MCAKLFGGSREGAREFHIRINDLDLFSDTTGDFLACFLGNDASWSTFFLYDCVTDGVDDGILWIQTRYRNKLLRITKLASSYARVYRGNEILMWKPN